jgi:hypothetical protein
MAAFEAEKAAKLAETVEEDIEDDAELAFTEDEEIEVTE